MNYNNVECIINDLCYGSNMTYYIQPDNTIDLLQYGDAPCIYILFDESICIYIGQSRNIKQRLKQHNRKIIFDKYIILKFDYTIDLYKIENMLIKTIQPPLNGYMASFEISHSGEKMKYWDILNKYSDGKDILRTAGRPITKLGKYKKINISIPYDLFEIIDACHINITKYINKLISDDIKINEEKYLELIQLIKKDI